MSNNQKVLVALGKRSAACTQLMSKMRKRKMMDGSEKEKYS